MKLARAVAAATLLAGIAAPALAHHSYAMFEAEKTYTLQGTVKEMQWGNPHIWLEVAVSGGPNAGDWSFEGGNLGGMKRNGWTRDTLKPGDKVVILAHPMRNGTKAGSLLKVTWSDGHTMPGGGAGADVTDPNAVAR